MPTAKQPGRLSTIREIRAPLDWATILLRAPKLLKAPRGDGRPIILLPGYGTDESSLRPLAAYLRYLGYAVQDWGLGRNNGKVDRYTELVGDRVKRLYEEHREEAITLIGWSLGGVIARETARTYEPYVREVITLGTPIIGGPKYTAVGEYFARSANIDLCEFEKEVHARNTIGIKQPVTSIYSKLDGVVDWRASIDVYNEQAKNIEVRSSHFGIGANGKVWGLIAEILAG